MLRKHQAPRDIGGHDVCIHPHALHSRTDSISGKVRERDRARVEVVLHVPPLEPRLADLPLRSEHGRYSENVRRADRAVRGPIQHVRACVDVVHFGARREAEPEARGRARAVVRSLS